MDLHDITLSLLRGLCSHSIVPNIHIQSLNNYGDDLLAEVEAEGADRDKDEEDEDLSEEYGLRGMINDMQVDTDNSTAANLRRKSVRDMEDEENDDDDDDDEDGDDIEIKRKDSHLLPSYERYAAGCVTRSFYSEHTSLKYVQTLNVLALVSEMLLDDQGRYLKVQRTMSLRDVYYTMKHIFSNQASCNSTVLDVGRMLGLRRHEMGIVPASRGKIAGCLRFSFLSNRQALDEDSTSAPPLQTPARAKATKVYHSITDCTSIDKEGLPITSQWTSTPAEYIQSSLVGDDARLLLVVEKEGPFNRLCEEKFFHRVPCIMVTGCGIPDVATRSLVSKIAAAHPELTVVGVCDYNPYGAALLLTYMSSSLLCATRLETGHVLCARLRWLGMRSSHVASLQERLETRTQGSGVHLEPYTSHDVTKIAALLKCPAVCERPQWQKELQSMQRSQVKCELEAWYALGMGAFGEYVFDSLRREDYI